MVGKQKESILDAWDWCDDRDKSTNFMLQYMMDVSGLSYDEVVDYVVSDRAEKDRAEYYRQRGDLETAKVFES